MEVKFSVTAKVTEDVAAFTYDFVEKVWEDATKGRINKKFDFLLYEHLKNASNPNQQFEFKFVWNLNNTAQNLVENVDVYVNGQKMDSTIVIVDNNIRVLIDFYGIKVEAHTYYFMHSWSELAGLEKIFICSMYEDDVREMIFNKYIKSDVLAAIETYVEPIIQERQALKQAFLEYVYAQGIHWWAEQDYFGGFGASQRSYVFSATKEWLDERKSEEFLWDDAHYWIGNAQPIETFPYWEKVLEEKKSKELCAKLNIPIYYEDAWHFRDRGNIDVRDIR